MNVFDLMATLSLDRSAYNRGLHDAEGEAKSFGGRLANTLGGAAKIAGAALAAAGAGIAAVSKQALGQYANYEQLVGGVETLFGDAADTVIASADRAFATAGLSANEYMETVTSFSASLIQATAGDTAQAAEYADMALRDMSDNANKMGTNMASIQNAYQGFAKQNYTMLDNLKLGYGGTKTEMVRLVEDAERLNDTFHAVRDENGDIALSYADVVEAIHIVQQNMGITGTTAAEAAGTITGSTMAVKAAWQNLLTGLGDETADLDKLINNFTDTLLTNIGNMAPRVEKIIRGIGKASTKLIPKLLKEALKLVKNLLPDFVDAAKSLVKDIGKVIFEAAPDLIADAISLIADLGTQLGNAMPTLIPALQRGFGAILQAFAANLPALATAALTIIEGLAEGLVAAIPVINEQIPVIIDSIATFLTDNIGTIIDAGITLFTALVNNASAIISIIAEKLPGIVTGIVDALTDPEDDCIGKMISAGVDLFVALISNVDKIVLGIAEALPGLVERIGSAIKDRDNLDKIVAAGITLFGSLIEDTGKIVEGMLNAIGTLCDEIITRIVANWFGEDAAESFKSVGKKWMSWLFEGFRIFDPPGGYAGVGKQIADNIANYSSRSGYTEFDTGTGSAGSGASGKWGIVESFEKESAGLDTAIDKTIEHVTVKTRGAAETWSEDGKDAVRGFFQGIDSEFEANYDEFGDHFEYIQLLAQDTLGIHSPSTVFAEIGEFAIEGLGVGFTNKLGAVASTVVNATMALVDAVKRALGIHSPSTVFEGIGSNMALGLARGYKRTMAEEAASMAGLTNTGDGAHVTQVNNNIYAYQMTPAQAFEASQQQAALAEFLG